MHPPGRMSIHIPLVFDQMFKYRARPPTYAHILLTTPQKHPRLASYQLWSRSEQAQAQNSRKTAKITFFHCQTQPGPQLTSYASITFIPRIEKVDFSFFFSQGRMSACTSLFFLTKCSNIELVHQHMTASC